MIKSFGFAIAQERCKESVFIWQLQRLSKKIIKQLLIEREKSVKQLDELFGISRQSMSNKMYIDNFSFDDVLKIVDYLDCDIKFVTRDKFLSGDFYEGKE